ncbi:hypothetical protein LWI28_011886 [Acer negundo]|uniref:Uncharacterized protein n=1 Tax=Acer negundo TaxID=4023 RepID=A0AAD5NGL3_ACENE|nr:hypothetical protein LWI28_011886 [Acer negundo]
MLQGKPYTSPFGDKFLLKKPGPMKVPADRRNQYKYCDFHEDVGHNTSKCYSFRNQIEGLEAADRRRDGEKESMQQIQVIHTISECPTLAGTSNNSRKNHARKIPRLNASHKIFKVSSGSRDPSRSTKIVFVEEDVYNTVQPHEDPMVNSVQIANCWVHRVLIDTGDFVMPMGSKILLVIVGEAPLQQNVMMEFIMVDTPSAYNAILGMPFLSGIRGL